MDWITGWGEVKSTVPIIRAIYRIFCKVKIHRKGLSHPKEQIKLIQQNVFLRNAEANIDIYSFQFPK